MAQLKRAVVRLLPVVILIGVAMFAALASLHAVHTASSANRNQKLLWSADFESGRQDTYFNDPNTFPPVCGNNPGSISRFAHSGKYAGYYHFDSPHNSSGCRAYYNVDFNCLQCPKIPDTKDFYVELWVYVPSTTIADWVSFVSIKFTDYKGVEIDSSPDSHQALFIHNDIFTDASLLQSDFDRPIVAMWPFDKWFKIGVEVHYRPSDQISQVIVYQDDLEILRLQTHALDPQPRHFINLHFGVYTGGNQPTFAVYNDDIALYDLTQTSTTSSSTTTSGVPGFPLESLLVGSALGLLFAVIRRRQRLSTRGPDHCLLVPS